MPSITFYLLVIEILFGYRSFANITIFCHSKHFTIYFPFPVNFATVCQIEELYWDKFLL